jgi:hypothetical protein
MLACKYGRIIYHDIVLLNARTSYCWHLFWSFIIYRFASQRILSYTGLNIVMRMLQLILLCWYHYKLNFDVRLAANVIIITVGRDLNLVR